MQSLQRLNDRSAFRFSFAMARTSFLSVSLCRAYRPIVSDLFEMLFRDMPDQTGNEFHYRDGFHNKFVVLMSVIMKSNIFTIVFINAGSGNDGAAKISADVFGNNLRITFIGLDINIKAIFVSVITFSLALIFWKEGPSLCSIRSRRALQKALRRKV